MATTKKYVSLEKLGLYDDKIKEVITDGDAASLASAKEYANSLASNYDAAGAAATAKSEAISAAKTETESQVGALANGQVKTNTDAIKAIKDDADIDSFADVVAALANKQDSGDYALSKDVGELDFLSTTKKSDLVEAINEVFTAVGTGGTNAVVTIDTTSTSDGALKSYTIKQGGNVVGTIDIPKDMVVEAGEVVTNPAGKPEGTYIKLVLANVEEPLYINVGTLVDLYTAENNATQVQISINEREISAIIVDGSVGTAKIAENAVTTVKIADGNVTKGKLSSDVQDSLNNADTAYTHSQAAHAPVGAQANIIESIKVNGSALTITDKAVDITVPTDNAELTNGAGYLVANDIANKADKATTLAGYGITDTYTSAQTDTAIANAVGQFVECSQEEIEALFA